MANTPALDRLVSEIAEAFPERARQADLRQAVGAPPVPPAASHLRSLSPLVDTLVLKLHRVGRRRDASTQQFLLRHIAHQLEISRADAVDLHQLMNSVKAGIREMTDERLATYTDAQVGAVLVDLYGLDYAEVDPDDPTNASDYNMDDEFPKDFETPHNYLADFIAEVVIAKLMKTRGRELLLTWADAAGVNK